MWYAGEIYCRQAGVRAWFGEGGVGEEGGGGSLRRGGLPGWLVFFYFGFTDRGITDFALRGTQRHDSRADFPLRGTHRRVFPADFLIRGAHRHVKKCIFWS